MQFKLTLGNKSIDATEILVIVCCRYTVLCSAQFVNNCT